MFDLIDEAPIIPDAPDAVSLPHGAGSVAFEHVRFRYQDDVPLIEDMNLKVEPGQRIALVGPTGCGKTTLVNLLMRFYEINSGTLRVDGHPIDTVTRDSLRAILAWCCRKHGSKPVQLQKTSPTANRTPPVRRS